MSDAAEKISKLRIQNGLTQQELAEKLCTSRSLVAMWEAGTRTPDYCSIVRMAEMFGVEKSEFVCGQGGDGSAVNNARSPSEPGAIDNEIAEIVRKIAPRASKEELTAVLKAFLSTRGTRDNEIFMARYLFKKSYKEIALDLKMSASAVSVRLSRMRKKLTRFILEEKK